jgi:hypothetical protein
MDRYDNPPFDPKTFIDSIGEHLLGREWIIQDDVRGNNLFVRIKLLKNTSGINLLPKRLVKLGTGSTNGFETEAIGYSTVDAENCLPVFEGLPDAGVPTANYFFVVSGGPALVKTSLAGDARNVINEGDWLTNTAGATTGATSGGRAALQNIQASTANATAGEENAQQVQFALGRAASAKTTNNTDADLLVFIQKKW